MLRALALLLLLAPALPRAADGAEIYRRKCAGCHGADGGGGPKKLTDLASPAVQGKSDQELLDVVAKGTADKRMPGFRGKLADAEIKAAVEHMRTLRR